MEDKLGTPKSNEWRIPMGWTYTPMLNPNEEEVSLVLNINNPCGHDGYSSSVCEICGYPDPRKVIATLNERVKEKDAEIAALKTKHRQLENAYIMMGSEMDAISDILEGKEPSDFMMSFGIVREAWDKIAALRERVGELESTPNPAVVLLAEQLSEEQSRVRELEAEVRLWKETSGHEADGLESWKKIAEKLEAANAKYKKALEELSIMIYCDGPGCPWCESGEKHHILARAYQSTSKN